MKIRLHHIFYFVFGLLITSCGKDFLNVEPTNASNAGDAIKAPQDAQVIINGIMRAMTSSDYYGRNFIMYGDAKGGDLTIYSAGRGLDALYTFNHSITTNSYSGYWSQIYFCLLQVNNLIENIEKLKTAGTAEGFDEYEGEALTLRALMYFDLVRLYGKPYNFDKTAWGVPNITSVLKPFDKPLRNTVEENYRQIMADLIKAAPLLSKEVNNSYINYYGNLALQARVNLYMNNPAAALSAAEEIINSGKYTLYTPGNWATSWTSQFGSESIFELVMLTGEADLGSSSLGYYLRRKGDGGGAAAGWFGASDGFLNRLKQDTSDVRWSVMAADELSTTAKPRLGSCYKYSGNTSHVGDKGSQSAVNIKVIRLSEVYLIAAEAALATDKEKAAGYLNAIRKRSPNLAPATAATVTMDMILDERSKELFCEGHRFFDMIRLNKQITFNDEFVGTITTRPKTIDRSYYKIILPISQDEINRNRGLEAQQNPGYN
ncbi:glycan metabolism protein RagB [Niabella ginsenosidivorans]|uniref:Glycan metabolism protein RagB n=1 Tax=Niabella ginsenosidivorans TaxID=1176587 RepID=A0A1A9I680_9BACT|nr:RagB/SusD family nutrient uptake outer membrane protein [Niabella ginsenosidivorans]ANH82559.1 glycan metabolism protein RagB [Niabella ginsenosidivorans]